MISMPTKKIYLYPNAPCEKTMEEMDIPNMPYYKDPLLGLQIVNILLGYMGETYGIQRNAWTFKRKYNTFEKDFF